MACEHAVQFYDEVPFLAQHVAGYLAPALDGGAAVAVARASTLTAIAAELGARGYDVDAFRAAGRLELVDADELLSKVMDGEVPDRERFREHVGGLIARMSQPLHVYGEMVDVLWTQGKRDATLRLEELWVELGSEHALSLLCGYHLAGFAGEQHVAVFEAICAAHEHVAPSEHAGGAAVAELEQRARSLENEVERRTRIERRMEMLLQIAADLAAASSRDEIARIAVDQGLVAVGAREAALWELVPGTTRLHMLAVSSSIDTTNWGAITLDSDSPMSKAVRDNEPVLLGSYRAYREQFPTSFARIDGKLPYAEASFALMPVAVDDVPIGGLVFTYDHRREFASADRAFKAILVRQIGLALARIRSEEHERALLANEKRAREDMELLYGVIDALNRIDDIASVFEIALRAAERGATADRSAVLLFEDDGRMHFKAWHGLSRAYREAVDGHSPWKRDTREPTPVWVDDTERDPAWLQYRDVFRAEGIRALAFVPLVYQGKLVGKLMLYRDQARPFTARELQLASTIAVHVAQAVERKRADDELARAYREERSAHLEAEAATRAREEILSVVSHDLRNPLGTVLMGASTLLQVDSGDKSHRVRTVAERIHRQAERMARLIEDLVDFAGIQAGRLAIQPAEHAPSEIITATTDIFAPLAKERGLVFEAKLPQGLPPIHCDSDRAVQVMANLVSNALKVTPRGGRIAIGAEPIDREVVFYVRDTGPGIEPEELPSLFERYWRSKTSSYKGAGLGLSIARGIVDAHGGRIWAESQLGAGATFYFSLSSLRNN